ncbi:Mss4p nuclear export [Dispira simplex]|nr:Mss4p nuclear export [Dispira simplex]
MSKRSREAKVEDDVSMNETPSVDMSDSESNASGSDSDNAMEEVINVDFEFFDPRESDYHSIKQFLNQHFGEDGETLELSGLADLIVKQPLIGTCVKVEQEGDPYAMLTVLNMNQYATHPTMQKIGNYLIHKSQPNSVAHTLLKELLEPGASRRVGLILSERFLNMPPQITPPMYRMLAEEIQWAVEDKEPYEFDYYIIVAKVYKEVQSTVDEKDDDGDEVGGHPKGKHANKSRKKGKFLDTTFYYQPEEELLERHCELYFDYKLSKSSTVSDSKRAFNEFGILPARRAFIVPVAKMTQFVENLASFV